MLNRAKLLEQVIAADNLLFTDTKQEFECALAIWQKLIDSDETLIKLVEQEQKWPMPVWQHTLGSCYEVCSFPHKYAICGIDGSQVYPDRHEGFDCGLINIGAVELFYGDYGRKPVVLTTIPYFIIAQEFGSYAHSDSILDSLRTEFEFKHGLITAKNYLNNAITMVTLFDGSFIFWHLENKDIEIKQRFIVSYLALMQQFYEQQCLIAGYISLPKSKELINIIRNAVLVPSFQLGHEQTFDTITDADIMAHFLQVGKRSTIFYATASIIELYPDHLKPCFVYSNNGYEIVRIEFPAWIAEQELLVDYICQIIADQVEKGRGYPVCLSEAHEAAVVTNHDREFFYQMLRNQAVSRGLRVSRSQKLQKKCFKSI